MFLFSSVQNVSQRKVCTVPLPSNADNEASRTEQRQLIGKLENKCRKRAKDYSEYESLHYFFLLKSEHEIKSNLV